MLLIFLVVVAVAFLGDAFLVEMLVGVVCLFCVLYPVCDMLLLFHELPVGVAVVDYVPAFIGAGIGVFWCC